MGAFIFKCPKFGVNVQGWIAEDPDAYAADEFVAIECMACKQSHLINVKTGRGPGERNPPSSDE